MSVLWAHVFPNLLHDKKRKRIRADIKVHIDIELDRIHRMASRLAPSSNPRCVKRAWVRDSMDEFVKINLAKRTGRDRYRVEYSTNMPRQLERIGETAATKSRRTDNPKRNQE